MQQETQLEELKSFFIIKIFTQKVKIEIYALRGISANGFPRERHGIKNFIC